MSTRELRENPYQMPDGEWFWDDEKNCPHGPYGTQMDALYAILTHMRPKPAPWWKRILSRQ